MLKFNNRRCDIDEKVNNLNKTFNKARKRIGLVVLILFILINFDYIHAATYYSRITGTWTTNTTWSLSSGGGAVGAGIYPVAGDVVIIERGFTVTINTAVAACASLQIGSFGAGGGSGAGTLNYTVAGNALTVSGLVQVGGWGNAAWTGTITFFNTSSLTAGSLILGGTGATPATGTITMTAGSTLTTGSLAVGTAGDIWTPSTGTVILNATNTLPATIFASFGNLTISSGTTALGQATTTTGLLNLAGGSMNMADFTLTLGSLTGAGNLTNTSGGTTAQTITIGSDNTSPAAYSGAISDGTNTGSVSITKIGTGSLTLSGNNTYSGTTTLSAGTLNINSPTAIGSGPFTISAGATTIDNTSGAPITLSNNNVQNWNANFAFTGTNNLNLGTGAVSMSAARQITVNGGILTVGGVISGAFNLNKLGVGALTLSGANTFTGGATLSLGTLNINNAQALGTVAGTFIISGGTIDNTSGSPITLINYPQTWGNSFIFTGTNYLNLGTGAVTMSAAPTVTVNGGELAIGGIISGAFKLTKAGTGMLTLFGANTFTGGTTLNAGTLNINNSQALGTVAGTFTIAAGTAIDNTSGAPITTLNYPQAWNLGFTFTGTQNLNLGNGNIVLSAAPTVTTTAGALTIGGAISGNFRLTKAGAGTLTISGASSSTAGTTLNAGTININNTNALGTVAGTFIINGGTIDNTSAGAITTINYPMTWGGDFAFTGTQNLNFGTGAVAMSAARQVSINGGTLAVGGIISGGFRLTKSGAGILTLSGVNTFTGGTTLNAGTLNINSANALGTVAGTFIINGGSIDNTTAGSITTVNYPITWNADIAFTGTQNLNLGTGVVTMGASHQVTVTNNTLTVGGAISSAANDLTKLGNGTLTLGGAISIKNLNINAGTLADGGSTINVSGNVVNNGTHSGAGNITLTGGAAAHNITGTGQFQNMVLNDANGATLGSNTTINGTLTLTNGLLYLNNFNLQMALAGSAIGGVPSSSNMVVINGTGQMQKWFAVGASVFNYPVGDNAGNYSPATLNFSANTTAGLVGVKVSNAKHPANTQVNNYINRYWSFTAPTLINYTYSAIFQYVTTPVTDVVGSDAYILSQRYDNGTTAWTTDIASSANTGTHQIITNAALTQVTGKLDNNDFTAYNGGTNLYYWSKATGNWSAAATWEVSTTPVDPGVGLGTPATAPPTNLNSSGITIRNANNITLNNSYTVDNFTVIGTLTIPAGQTLTVANGGYTPDMVANTTGVITNSGTITATGTISFLGNATYNHTQNGGTIPTATWSATSLVSVTFGASATLNGLGQTFGNFTYTTAGAFIMTLGQSPTIQGTLTVTGATGTFAIGANSVDLNGSLTGNGIITMTSGTLFIYGDNSSSGVFTAGTGTVNYNGVNQIVRSVSAANSYYNLQISNGGIKTFSNATPVNINGNLDISNATLAFRNNAIQTVTLVGNLNQTAGNSGTIDMSPGNFVHVLNLGGTTNTIGTLTTGAAASVINYTLAGVQQVFASPNYQVLNINGGGASIKTLQGNITVNNNLTVAAATVFNLGTTASTVSVGGTATINGSLNFGTTTDKTATITGIITLAAAGVIDMSGSANHALYLRGGANVFAVGGILSPGAGNQTVYYDGDINQNVAGLTYNNLYIGDNNGSAVAGYVKTLLNNSTINGNLTITGVSATALMTLNVNTFTINVSGTTTINGYGIFSHTGATGTNNFTGLVTINSNGQWTIAGNTACNFQNGLTFNGSTFTSGTGNYTFTTNSQNISGGQSMTITNNLTTTVGNTVTNRNTAGLSAGIINGAGNFVNGDVGYNSILYLTGAGNPLSLTGTIDFASNPNTVNYSGVGAQTIGAYNFYNLTTSGNRAAAAITLVNGGTIGVASTFNPSATNCSYTTTNNTINFNGSLAQNILPPAASNPYNNVTISGGSTKTLQGAISILATGVLNLSGGVIELNNYNLTLLNNAAGAIIPGLPYGTNNMIATDGPGYLQKNGAAAAGFQITYPVGSNGYYSPMSIATIGSVIPTYMRVIAVPTAINPSYIKVNWNVTSNVALNGLTGVTATFTYDPAEANGASPNMAYSPDGGVTWQNPPTIGSPSYGASSFTITGTKPFTGTAVPFTGIWTMGFKTFYSYQTGNWNTASTWTTDPSGTLQLGSAVPGYNDNVVILSGRIVSLSSDNATQNLSITINAGGYLNLGTYQFTNGLLSLSGQGILQLSSANFPTVTTDNFILAGGGTTEYDANITLPASQAIYNNLAINTSVGGSDILKTNLTLNGDLHVEQGTFQINDNTAQRLNITINGNVIVESTGLITVGTGNTVTGANTPTTVLNGGVAPFINYYNNETHTIIILGNFINNGTVRFTNQTYPQYGTFPNNGAVTIYFQGATSDTLTCNGLTDFYNLVLDKGTDPTYSLTINSSDYPNFRLFGANVAVWDINGASNANPNIKKALWIRNGNLILTGSTVIPSLTEGITGSITTGTPTSDYIIPASAALTINGGSVIVLSTADDFTEVNAAYGLSGGSNAIYGIGAGSGSSLSVYGKLQMNSGYLSTRESSGLLYWSYNLGQVVMNGGIIDTKQIHSPEAANVGLINYSQSSGTVILRGRFTNTINYTLPTDLATPVINTARVANGIDAGVGTFYLNSNGSNGFSMSNGTIAIYDVCGTLATPFAFQQSCPVSNISITGGTLQITPTTGTGLADANYYINTTSPFGNLLVNLASGASSVQLNTNAITILNNFSLQTTGSIFNANNLNVTVGGNLLFANGTTYTPGTNTTILNGSTTQTLTVNLAAPLSLNNLTITTPSGVEVNMAGTQTSVNVFGNFNLTAGTLNDNGDYIYVTGNVYNSGLHTGTGKIQLNGTAAQTIDGNGVFQNLELNNTTVGNTAPVSLVNNTTINGALNLLSNKIFIIGTYNLLINSSGSITSTPGFTSSCYIHGSGNSGDGGITKAYSTNAAFVFPVGCFSTNRSATYAYTPATIGFSASPTTYGSITIVPVGYEEPSTTVKSQSLTFFWHVISNGFTGPYSVTHTFIYSPTDIQLGVLANYVPSLYNRSNYTWNNGLHANINTGTFSITDWGVPTNSSTFLDADYTAGDNTTGGGAFGTPKVYYSLANGLWNSNATWTFNSSHTGAQAGSVPGINDIVVIGNKDSVYLTNATYILNTPAANVAKCASLQIDAGACLDIDNCPGSIFSTVVNSPLGNGDFRVSLNNGSGSTFAFPSGDFSAFNTNLGTTELYTNNAGAGTTYWLPQNIPSYGNLKLSPLGGSNIIFGNLSLTIYGNLITNGQNADSWFLPTWNPTTYPTAPTVAVAKTITIKGNLQILGGALIWYGNGALAQNIVVNGDVVVSPWGAIQNWGAANNQSLAIGGSLINNTNNATQGGVGTGSWVDFNTNGAIPVTFFGPNSAFIKNSAGTPGTTFNTVTVNKGSSPATTLTCNIAGTLNTNGALAAPNDNWLNLQNGTFIYNRSGNFNITTGSTFTIPSTAGLTINTPSNVNIAQANVSNNTLYLSGNLTLAAGNSGNVYIGANANNQHNDIEYSSGGSASIEVDGGNLIVNGAIRRNPANPAGVLSYTQTGGQVIILGNSTLTSNAKLEVVNSGSQFNMSGGIISIVRGGGINYGDLYLRPQTSSVTGGTIQFSQVPPVVAPVIATVNAAQSYLMDANIPLNNLTITGTANTATVSLMVDPLNVNGNLILSNVNSILTSNNKNITIGGNFSNNGTYNYGTNLTNFNGSVQNISGATVTNFYNLNISPVTSVTENSSPTVNGYLSIGSGTFVLGINLVNLKSNLTNNGTYTDNNTGSSGVSLSGSAQQVISGTGSFGSLTVNNNAGALATTSLSLQDNLTLTKGNLTISSNLLSLGLNSNINGYPFGVTNMIVCDGVASSAGLQKFFNPTAILSTFTFPVGVSGKYTPAIYTYTNNATIGYIQVNPVNNNEPAVLDPTNVLHYYWQISSSGISGFAGNALLQYLPGDVQGGPESSYVTAWLLTPGTYWAKSSPAGTNVDAINHQLTFNYPAGTANLNGDYTAGLDAAIPSEVPAYQSIVNGFWSDPTIWQPVGAAPPCPAGGPNGFIVIINNAVTTDVNYCSAYQTIINDSLLVVSPTYGHNLGTVSGNGVLHVESGNLPAGNYASFVSCANNGTIDFGGTGNYTLIVTPFQGQSIPNLFFTGTGKRILPNSDLTICNRFVINGPIVDNSANNRHLYILGTMEKPGLGAFTQGTGANATVTFSGTSPQTIGGPLGNFTFNNMEVNNSAGLSIGTGGTITISTGNLYLTNGIISTTSANKLTITNTSAACVVPAGGSANSFINRTVN